MKKHILGVDIGGSKANFILWDGQKVLSQKKILSPSFTEIKKEIYAFAVKRVGFSLKGIVDQEKNILSFSPELKDFDGRNFTKEFPDLEVKAENDANCFLLAEFFFGRAKGEKNVLAVVFGSGIGGAFLLGQKGVVSKRHAIFRGWAGAGGEFGKMIIEKNKTWEELYQSTKNNPLKQDEINAIGFANLINLFNPSMIVIGGGGARKINKQKMERLLFFPKKQKTKIVFGSLDENAPAIGAALLF